MKDTVIEWLLNNLISEPYSEADFKHNKECWNKAEAMEKEQRIEDINFRYRTPSWVDINIEEYLKLSNKKETYK